MANTAFLGLPLLQPSQAQKHVTVNEALQRVDALAQLVLESRATTPPPVSPVEGEAWAVPAGAVNAWSGKDGMVAVYLGGGWDFVTPVEGWRAWIADEWLEGVWSGGAWVAGALSLSPSGSAFAVRSLEVDHVVSAGASSTTGTMIPSHSLVFGVAGRVLSDLGGAATSWQLGVAPASPDRYGSGLGTTTGSWVKGLTSSPLAYYADTALTLTAVGGDFGGGSVRLVVHYAELTLPSA